jgi:hypothetical protein
MEGMGPLLAVAALAALAAFQPLPAREPPQSPQAQSCPLVVLVNDGGTSQFERAPNSNFRFGRAVYLLKASELAAGGLLNGSDILSIGWHYSVPGAPATGDLTIYLQNTSDTANAKSTDWTTAIAGMTVVHAAPTMIGNDTSFFDISFTGGSPFTYTGGGLYVAFDWQWPGPAAVQTVVLCNKTLTGGLKGASGTSAPPGTIAASDFRPETRLTSSASLALDLSVDAVVTLGEIPLATASAHAVRALVTNRGTNDAVSIPVSLSVSGADTFSDMQMVPSIKACEQALVTFAPFSPGAVGSDLVAVSVPTDANPLNDGGARALPVSSNSYSYKYPGSNSTTGAGFDGIPGRLVAKFPVSAVAKINAVDVEFFIPNSQTYRVVIFDDDGDAVPGALLYRDAADRSVVANQLFVTATLPSPLQIGPGNVFVGVEQIGTINLQLAADSEFPLRPETFYVSTATGSGQPFGPWTDLAPAPVKLDVGVKLEPCLAPSEVHNLTLSANKISMSWTLVPTATAYDVLRGNVPALPVGPGGGDERCFPNIAIPQYTDPNGPALGVGFWYVVRAENSCGTGSYGNRSNGTPRASTTCP